MVSRSDLAERVPLDAGVAAKSFVLEVHTDDAPSYLSEIAGPENVAETQDVFLSHVHADSAGEFWVDRLNPRFWVFHTIMPSTDAVAWLTERVESRRDTDWMWLPSGHLRNVAPDATPRRARTEFNGDRLVGSDEAAHDLKIQLSGSHAERLLDKIADFPEYRSAVSFSTIEVTLDDPDLGSLRESVRRWGAFAAHGESFAQHAQFVQLVAGRYARLIETIEELALRFNPLGTPESRNQDDHDGASLAGMPIAIRFSRVIPDLSRFCDELFSSRAPFRLWGSPQIGDGLATVEAVDLHVGERLGMEIGQDWMRVYLHAGACGNTVARLISNLQSRFDGALSLAQPDLQQATSLSPQLSAQ